MMIGDRRLFFGPPCKCSDCTCSLNYQAMSCIVRATRVFYRILLRLKFYHDFSDSIASDTRNGLGEGVQPPLNLQNCSYCVLAKCTLQGLLLYSLNPKFYTGKS